MQHEHAAKTLRKDMQHGHEVWTCRMDMRHGRPTWTCTQTCMYIYTFFHTYMDINAYMYIHTYMYSSKIFVLVRRFLRNFAETKRNMALAKRNFGEISRNFVSWRNRISLFRGNHRNYTQGLCRELWRPRRCGGGGDLSWGEGVAGITRDCNMSQSFSELEIPV